MQDFSQQQAIGFCHSMTAFCWWGELFYSVKLQLNRVPLMQFWTSQWCDHTCVTKLFLQNTWWLSFFFLFKTDLWQILHIPGTRKTLVTMQWNTSILHYPRTKRSNIMKSSLNAQKCTKAMCNTDRLHTSNVRNVRSLSFCFISPGGLKNHDRKML